MALLLLLKCLSAMAGDIERDKKLRDLGMLECKLKEQVRLKDSPEDRFCEKTQRTHLTPRPLKIHGEATSITEKPRKSSLLCKQEERKSQSQAYYHSWI